MKEKLVQNVTVKRAKLGLEPNLTAYLDIDVGELLVCPLFGPSRVISLASLKVISLSTSWGAFSH